MVPFGGLPFGAVWAPSLGRYQLRCGHGIENHGALLRDAIRLSLDLFHLASLGLLPVPAFHVE